MVIKAHTVRTKSRHARQERRQINVVFAGQSSSLRLLEEAERLTGQPPTKIIRSLIDTRLGEWLEEEIARRRRLEEAALSGGQDSLTVRRMGRMRPRYREEGGVQPCYAEVVAQRVSPALEMVAVHGQVSIRQATQRPRSRPAPMTAVDDDTEPD